MIADPEMERACDFLRGQIRLTDVTHSCWSHLLPSVASEPEVVLHVISLIRPEVNVTEVRNVQTIHSRQRILNNETQPIT
jgi:hypothetical protein